MSAEVAVKLLSSRAGHRFDSEGRVVGQFAQSVGDVVQMPRDEAERYIERGLAEAVPLNQQTQGRINGKAQ